MSFKGFMTDFQGDGGRPPLALQTSIYSLTFDEWQSTMGGPGKDFGSMNMDEFLKSIWSAEESSQATNTMPAGHDAYNNEVHVAAALQRQGSLTLPRTLSQKTVDEVWRNLSVKEETTATPLPQRQQTLKEMKLEEFLVRAGVAREDGPTKPGVGGTGFFGVRSNQQDPGTNGGQLGNLNPNLPLNANGVRSNPQQQLPIYPKQQPVSYVNVSPIGISNVIGNGRNNGTDTTSVSPIPYVFGNGFIGRKGGPVEKVVERRQRRMIKNRESAARSRARKQAYTMELEAEIAKLKEENQDLKKKEEKQMEVQKNQDMEIENLQRGGKISCLRRTQTGSF